MFPLYGKLNRGFFPLFGKSLSPAEIKNEREKEKEYQEAFHQKISFALNGFDVSEIHQCLAPPSFSFMGMGPEDFRSSAPAG
jgi:hypothetical protein